MISVVVAFMMFARAMVTSEVEAMSSAIEACNSVELPNCPMLMLHGVVVATVIGTRALHVVTPFLDEHGLSVPP